jgi:hypothetical protein
MNVIKTGRIDERRFGAYFADNANVITTGPTPESAIGRLAKTFPDRFQRPSREIGEAIMANPEAFGVTIEEEE